MDPPSPFLLFYLLYSLLELSPIFPPFHKVSMSSWTIMLILPFLGTLACYLFILVLLRQSFFLHHILHVLSLCHPLLLLFSFSLTRGSSSTTLCWLPPALLCFFPQHPHWPVKATEHVECKKSRQADACLTLSETEVKTQMIYLIYLVQLAVVELGFLPGILASF